MNECAQTELLVANMLRVRDGLRCPGTVHGKFALDSWLKSNHENSRREGIGFRSALLHLLVGALQFSPGTKLHGGFAF